MNKNVVLILTDITAEAFSDLEAIVPEMQVVRGSRDKLPDLAIVPCVKVVYGYAKRTFDTLLDNEQFKPDWLQILSAGYDRLDAARITERGIKVTNVRGIHGVQMTETLFGMLLSRARKLMPAALNQQAGIWNDDFDYEEITGRSMTIIGAGAIAREMARVAKFGFRMKVTGVSRRGRPDDAFDEVLPIDQWQDAVADADIVVNLLPLNEATHHFFDREAFNHFKQGAWFANLGRGGSVDTAALIDALDAGQLSFAALDVFEKEPLPTDSPLWKRQDVMLTPHVAGLSVFYDERAFDVFKRNLMEYMKSGKLAINVIDLHA